MVRAHHWLILLLGLSSLACADNKKPRTELILVADTDIALVDTVRFEISEGTPPTAEVQRSASEPAWVGVVPQSDSLGPLTVSAVALSKTGREMLRRTASVSFVRGETRVVELHLVERCTTVQCLLPSETCTEHGCRDEAFSAAELPVWQGEPPRLGAVDDAGTSEMDASEDAAQTPTGDAGDSGLPPSFGAWTDCGTGNSRYVDLHTDPNNCGTCGNKCKTAVKNAVATCQTGACGHACRILYDDCDGDESNGCEQALTVDAHCGACDMQCSSTTTCRLGFCR